LELQQCYPYCDHTDYIFYSTNLGAQRYCYQACQRTFQTLQKDKDLALKKQARKFYLEALRMRAIDRLIEAYHKTISQWMTQAVEQLLAIKPKIEFCSLMEGFLLCSLVPKKFKMLSPGSH
jgi:transposase-like protein